MIFNQGDCEKGVCISGFHLDGEMCAELEVLEACADWKVDRK